MLNICFSLPWITSKDFDLLDLISKNPRDPISCTLIRNRPLAILIRTLGWRGWYIPKWITRLLKPLLVYYPLYECGVLSSRVLHIYKLLINAGRIKSIVHQACVQGSCLRWTNLWGWYWLLKHHQLLMMLLITTQRLNDTTCWCLHLVLSLNRLLSLLRKCLAIDHLHEAWMNTIRLHHLLNVLLVSGELTCALRCSRKCVKVYIHRHRRLTPRVWGGLRNQLIYSVKSLLLLLCHHLMLLSLWRKRRRIVVHHTAPLPCYLNWGLSPFHF